MENITVSIAMITYNHEKYVEKAIKSVLMQEVNFQYEIVIGDDASQDNTKEIIKKYVEKYPNLFKPILREKNLGAIENLLDVSKNCSGKYYILLEGDDYWTDKNKLQEQVDYLEKHQECIATAHWCKVVDQHGDEVEEMNSVFNRKENYYTLHDFERGLVPGHTTTIMCRNIFIEPKYDYDKIFRLHNIVGDRTLHMVLVLQGKIFCLHKCMSDYRYVVKTGGTSYSSNSSDRNISYIWWNYYRGLEEAGRNIFQKKISLKDIRFASFFNALFTAIKHPTIENKSIVKKIWKESNEKIEMFFYCLRRILKRNIRKCRVMLKKR